jgi:GIY-YIG catalytic domain
MTTPLLKAFEECRSGYSADRVVADPELDRLFLGRCRELGIVDSDEQINRQLLNARKASTLLAKKTTHRTSFRDEGDYAFASEIAVRFLERRDGATLDDVICSPTKAVEFDQIAQRVCPGYSPLQYRWAALGLRKKRKLRPELIGHVIRPENVTQFPVTSLIVKDLPTAQGVYIFFCSDQTLYVGEATNLRNRLSKHLEHSDNKGLARWLWEHGGDDLHVELQVLPSGTRTKVRRAVESELIASRKPVFNLRP